MQLKLYMTAEKTQALGPYNRYVIWVQGCLRDCPNCISKDSRSPNEGYEVSTIDLSNDVINVSDIEGITISGGEPYLQEAALVDLLKRIKEKRDIGVIIYTGNQFNEIERNELTLLSDLVIDGIYIDKLNDGLSLRGSSNQNVNLITDRYKEEVKTHYGVTGRKIELHFKNNKTTLIGIPDKNSLKTIMGESR